MQLFGYCKLPRIKFLNTYFDLFDTYCELLWYTLVPFEITALYAFSIVWNMEQFEQLGWVRSCLKSNYACWIHYLESCEFNYEKWIFQSEKSFSTRVECWGWHTHKIEAKEAGQRRRFSSFPWSSRYNAPWAMPQQDKPSQCQFL